MNMDKANYFHEKYGLSKTHSAVEKAIEIHQVKPCRALDLGCGQGRNALYLALNDFEVKAVDYNPSGLNYLAELAQKENLHLELGIYDANQANLDEEFGLIISTVVFMFLNPNRITYIIENMQKNTISGGYNLIVSAMDTADCPCPMPFSFTFKENELREYYQDWELVEYDESMGSLHATDAQGNPIRLKFVTMLARKY